MEGQDKNRNREEAELLEQLEELFTISRGLESREKFTSTASLMLC